MNKRVVVWLLVMCGFLLVSIPAQAQKPSLKGSPASVDRMAEEARIEKLTRLSTGDKVLNFFRGGLLVELKGNENYHTDGVSYPYVRREVRTFVERFAEQSHGVCPTGLTVTSSTRPLDEQPSNASSKSVHPAGIAVDFHVPETAKCRAWFEKTLLTLEGKKVLEVTREKHPPHYHVAVYPKPYTKYLNSLKAAKKKAAKKK
jgi:hypothetical protein